MLNIVNAVSDVTDMGMLLGAFDIQKWCCRVLTPDRFYVTLNECGSSIFRGKEGLTLIFVIENVGVQSCSMAAEI